MENNFLRFYGMLANNEIQISGEKFNNIIINNYIFRHVTIESDIDQKIYKNMEESKVVIVDILENFERKTDNNYFFISFKNTILFVHQSSLTVLQTLFSINQKAKICFLSDIIDYFKESIKIDFNILDYNQRFQEEISNFNIHFYIKKSLPEPIQRIWKKIQRIIPAFLIKQSYEKLNRNRFKYFYTINKLSQLEKLNENDYLFLRHIGSGTMYKVQLFYHIEKEEIFAFKKPNSIDSEIPKLIKREHDNYLNIHHPLIPMFYGQFFDYKIIEFINGEELLNIKKIHLEFNEKITIIFELLIVFKYFHEKEFIFRDLKPDNIMIDENKTLVVIDFDRMVSKNFQNQNFTTDFSSIYVAPEVNIGEYSYKSDIYSIGYVIAFIILEKISDIKQISEIEDCLQIYEIISKCISKEQNQRPTIDELILEFYVYYHSKIMINHSIETNGKSFCLFIENNQIVSIENKSNNLNLENLLLAAYFENLFYNHKINEKIYRFFIFANKNNKYAQYNLGSLYLNGECLPFDIEKAIFYLTLSANQNFHKAQTLLGNIFYEGKYINCDINKSIYYFQLASNQGDADADFLLGSIYFAGKFVPRDLDKAVKYYSKAALQNDSEALFNLGIIFSDSQYEKNDIEQSIQYFSLAAIQEHPRAFYELGNIFYKIKNNVKKAIELYERASNIFNDPGANYKLGKIYYKGTIHFPRDIKKAIHYLSLSSDGGEFRAQRMLGLIYYEGKYIQKDIKKAIHYYSLAAEQNNPKAQYNLGVIYSDDEYDEYDINKAIEYYTLAANQHFPKAYLNIGFIYYKGQYVKKDINKAIHYFSLASDQNDVDAQYNLGIIYSFGKFIPCDIQKGIHYLSLAAQQNHSISQIILGDFYFDGEVVPFNIDKAIFYYTQAASNNNIDAQFSLASIYFNNQFNKYDITKAIHYLTLAADNNHEEAQFKLGKLFYEGKIIEPNINKSIYYLSLAAAQNNVNSQCMLGFIFYNDIYINHDIEKAIYYFSLAAKQNSPFSQCMLGDIYSEGKYLSRDINKAIHFYELASNQNLVNAQLALGDIYSNGKYISRDIDKAIHFYKLAADQNSFIGQTKLGDIFYEGNFIPRDINKSIYYYSLAAEQNYSQAQNELGVIYSNGQYVKRDIEKSIYYLTLAAENNFSYSQYLLGTFYYEGKYIEMDIKKAIHYFTLSSNKYESSLYYLGIIYFEGKYVQYDIDKAIEYFRKAASNNSSASQFFLGLIYFLDLDEKNHDIEKGIKYLIQSSENGYREAQFIVGVFYHEGKYIERDIKKAVYLYKELSSFNNNFAKNNLGVLYRNGFGDEIQSNIGLAIEYFKEAINQKNDVLSKYNLSITYLYDEPLIDDNINKSIELLIDLIELDFISFNELLCLSLIKKYGFNISVQDINHELEKHKNKPINHANSILNMIKINQWNESSSFEEKYLFYKNQNLLYDFRKDYISFDNLMKQNTQNNSTKKSKRLNITKDFYDGFGI